MRIFPKSVLLRKLVSSMHGEHETQHARQLLEAAFSDSDAVLEKLQSSTSGLTEEEAQRRLDDIGPNTIAQDKQNTTLRLLRSALFNPLVILLSILAIVSLATGDKRAAIVIGFMVVLGVVLRLVQETRAGTAAAKLRSMISVTTTAVREGVSREIPLSNLVPGDLVELSAGDMIPADMRILNAKDLFILQSSLTGESFPVEKMSVQEQPDVKSLLDIRNVCLLGTSVERGTATAVVVATGPRTYLGGMAKSMEGTPPQTAFDKGVSRFTWLMIRFIIVMVPLVFVINGLTKHDWKEAFFFSLAVAVGMTPEMLPMIVTVCLSKGAMLMSKKKIIVKHLNSIQNFGAMDVLCTDKTGTLTIDRVVLEKHCNVMIEEDDSVLLLAYLNSHFQTGLKNVLDRAILAHKEVDEKYPVLKYQKVDEMPFDFERRLMSVVVSKPEGGHRLICKGAPEEVFKRCPRFEYQNEILPMEQIIVDDLRLEYEHLSNDGFRVLAIAYRDLEIKAAYSKEDEKDMILFGYLAFFDPPKDTAASAIKAFGKHGVGIKVLTGDNEGVSRKICHEVGIPTDNMLLGAQVEVMSDTELADVAEKTTLFSRLAPHHKERIIRALQGKGHVVGFLGDGINDALALHVADVGISVDSAADIAKASADLILLEKSLLVLEEGVLEGRKVFVNILKYVRMGASSSFGNMFSVVGASAFLPFVPMAPIQILTNNLLYDFSQAPIPTDNVDAEQIAHPRPWKMKEITRFILLIGPCSSIFDYTTFFMMFYIFGCWNLSGMPLFQTGWFVESLLTQTLIIHVIRTNKIPFLQSRSSWQLAVTTVSVMLIGIVLPFSFLANTLGLTALPPLYWSLLLLTLLCYIVLTQSVKSRLLGKMLFQRK